MTRSLVIIDETDTTLSPIWKLGAATAAQLPRGRCDLMRISGRGDLRDQLPAYVTARAEAGDQLSLVSYWGHGNVGAIFVDGGEIMPKYDLLPLRSIMAPDGIVWFRTCSTFARTRGQAWAAATAAALGCTVAGFTHVIHGLQSGLCVLAPGAEPTWDPMEGGSEVWSSWTAPRTILATRMSIPPKYKHP